MACFPVPFLRTRVLLLNPNQPTSGQASLTAITCPASLTAITCLLRFSQIPCAWSHHHHHHAQPKETLLLLCFEFSLPVIYFRSPNDCFFCGIGSNFMFLNLLEPLQIFTGPCLGVYQNMTQFPCLLFLNSHFPFSFFFFPPILFLFWNLKGHFQ